MSQQFGYSNIHFPPAPVATVKLVATETHLATTDLNALLDTGADASFAPVELLESVQAGVGKIRYAHSLWGERQPFDS